MSERLRLIQSLITPAGTVADVGCDHGIIAEYCVNSGFFSTVIASDISENCLQKTKTRIGERDGVKYICCDGLAYECDEAIIAGMGGMLISKIIRSAASLPHTLIVSPHTDCREVRSTLIDCGYGITFDEPITDRDKFYFVIKAELGKKMPATDDVRLEFGTFVEKPSAPLQARLRYLFDTYSLAPERNRQKLELVKEAMRIQGMKFI